MTSRTTAVLTAFLVLTGPAAMARPPHKRALAETFGAHLAPRLNDCRTCHEPAEPGADDLADDRPHNPFGARLKAVKAELRRAGRKADIPARLEAIAGQDSDGDGASNVLELLTGHNPGEADDTPSAAELAAGQSTLAAFRTSRSDRIWNPFEVVRRPPVPTIHDPARVRNPIDAFVFAEHEARGLKPRPEATRAALLRRVCLDLTGLPPTAEELHAFLDDSSADAYEAVVDRLLASPRYGERWGRHWMDVWRYSDWAGWGMQVRDSQPHIWHWRDWIIASLNQDKGYDRMVVEMLAADEAAPEDWPALRATGYLVRNYKRLSREKWMQDVVDHTAQAFLGVTLGCARCHDHMFDPFLQKEYYQVRAIFEPHQVRIDRLPGQMDTAQDGLPRAYDADPGAKTFLYLRGDDRVPGPDVLPPGVPEALGGASFRVEPVELPRSASAPDTRAFVVAGLRASGEEAIVRARQALDAARREAALALFLGSPATGKALDALALAHHDLMIAEARQAALTAVLEAEALEDAGRRDSDPWKQAATAASAAQRRLAVREAERDVLVAWQARRAAPATRRAEADKKVTDAQKARARAEAVAQAPPTTAFTPRSITTYPATSTGRRLAFARWITSRDNPLAARVAVNHIWLRHFGRAIVPSVADFGRNGQRPSHPALLDWLAAELMDRGWSMKALHRLIVTSSTYRFASTPDPADLALDPDNVYLWRMAPRRLEAEVVRDGIYAVAGQLDPTMGGPDLNFTEGLTNPRRSVYFRHAAEKQMEFLRIFDGPAVTECYQRRESILPQQALALANSELTRRNARLLARSLATKAGPDPAAFTIAAFEHVLTRPPTPAELAECIAFLHQQARSTPGAGSAADPTPRARENLVHVLMNHHEFVTIR